MDADGGNAQRVLPAGHVLPFGEAVGYGEPLVSPDGRKVLLAARGLTVATLATGATRRLAAGEEASAAWSPDSERVVFSGREGKGLYVVDVRSGRTRTLLRRSWAGSAAWSPDGKWIAFVRQIGYGPDAVYVVHPDATGLRRLTRYSPNLAGGLAWSRDGRLAFIGSRGSEGRTRLVVVDVQARRVELFRSKLGDGTVSWSPDGRRLAYGGTGSSPDARWIYVVDADGRHLHRLTPSWPPSYDRSPVWSPDGRTLLFVRIPAGGGAARGIPEVWTMRADGTHRRPLTKAYPSGADNLEPAWIRGPVHEEPAPRAREVRRGKTVVLEVPFAVDGIAADGARVGIAPVAFEEQRSYRPTPPILLWHPGRGPPTQLVASACGGVQQVVLSGNRLAFDCNATFLDLIEQAVWVFDVRTRVPREVFFGHGGGPTLRGLYVDYVVGGRGLIAFGSERDDRHGFVRQRTLWRIDGFGSVALSARPTTGNVVAADGSRMAAELADGRVAILNRDASLVRVLPLERRRATRVDPFGVDPKSQFLLAGRELLLLEHSALRAYDTKTGALRWRRPVPAGAQLEDAESGLVVYTAGASVHLVTRRGETVLRTGAPRLRQLRGRVDRLVHAALTTNGLYYSFNVDDARYPGRVVFVPR